jgi:small-conductance mechanosensitive channel
MRSKQNTAAVALLALLAVTGYGVYATRIGSATSEPSPAGRSAYGTTLVVDQSALTTAQRLVRLPTASEERSFAEDALRIGDQEMDLAFADAVRDATTHPRALSEEAQAIAAQLQRAQQALARDQGRLAKITASLHKASAADSATLADRLELVKARTSLDQDQVDDAKQDLIRAGGDPQGQAQAMIAEHQASSKSSDSIRVNVVALADARGLIHRFESWQVLHQKTVQLRQAKVAAESSAVAFGKRHDLLSAPGADSVASPAGEAHADTAAAKLSHAESAALLATTRQRGRNERARAALDQRVDNQHRLADVYGRWIAVVGLQQRAVINRALGGVVLILIIALIGLFIDKWIESGLRRMSMDRRLTQTLSIVTRVSLQVLGVLFVLLVIFGPPNNLGTFLGLAGAGLTVALQDFIIGFFGWFMLMGKNGIRIGDFVEINGVTGEVVELGMFHTVLLETGSWTNSDQLTGRRVTFTNSFAIEGHYINFSTSGQWLWDEVRIVVPAGRDPYPIVDAIRKQVEEATADGAVQAEQHWKSARRSAHQSAPSAAPTVSIKPIMGGIEIAVRYITHVAERSALRTRLYHSAVDLLGEPTPMLRSPAVPARV